MSEGQTEVSLEDRYVAQSVPIRIDDADPDFIPTQQSQGYAESDFWSSAERSINSPVEEILEISLANTRMINLLTFKVSRFPCSVRVEWCDADGVWLPFEYESNDVQSTRYPTYTPVSLVVSESVPSVVNRANTKAHPQHYGSSHWRSEEWKTQPVSTSKIRFVLRRNPGGYPPRTVTGSIAAYSLALNQVRIGYRVSSLLDIPKIQPGQTSYESSQDVLGSDVFYSTYRQNAPKAIDSDTDTYWRSEPQPVNYSVVPLYLDVRDQNGAAQVVDRFYVDPVTPGVHCNLYYSEDEPTGDFTGAAQIVPFSERTEVGNTRVTADSIVLQGGDASVAVEVSPDYTSVDTASAWWVGLDVSMAEPKGFPTGDYFEIFSLGGVSLIQDQLSLSVSVVNSPVSIDIPLPPEYDAGLNLKVVLAYYPPGATAGTEDAVVVVTAANSSYFYEETDFSSVAEQHGVGAVRIGTSNINQELRVAIGIKGVVVKASALTQEDQEWFLAEGEAYVRDDRVHPRLSRGANANVVLRMHRQFYSPTNQFGLIGGSTDRMDSNIWTPINRDYVLKKGYLDFPPTRAKYWKFEFTQLCPSVFETFQVIDRNILCFPEALVSEQGIVGPQTSREFSPHGVSTMINGVLGNDGYSAALTALQSSTADISVDAQASSALVFTDPDQADQASDFGWIWQYQPWHMGSQSPRWTEKGPHPYSQIRVSHRTKIAYFVGIRELVPHRLDYTTSDDVSEYRERFQDASLIDVFEDLDLTRNGIVAQASGAAFESKTFTSFLDVRGVQFATIQTGQVQVLPDDDFDSPDLLDWVGYGDSIPMRESKSLVRIARGYDPNDYSVIDTKTYGELDALTYGEIEGLQTQEDVNNLSEGGMASKGSYLPMGLGEVTARALVSSSSQLGAPITIEIVSGENGSGIVVASSQTVIPFGKIVEISASYSPEDLYYSTANTYGQVQDEIVGLDATYGDVEALTYAEMENSSGTIDVTGVSARIRQQGAVQDEYLVHKFGLYDDPISWSFSADGGATWWSAPGVRNRATGVVMLPQIGREFRWRADFAQAGASVSALAVRPWYGSRRFTAEGNHDLDQSGSNQSGWDNYPSLAQHPLWKTPLEYVDFDYVAPPAVPGPFWRNLVPNPGAAGESLDQWTVENMRVERMED